MSYTGNVEDLGLLHERLSLDFSNTSGTHPSGEHNDFLTRYPNLIDWAQYVGILPDVQANDLLQNAAQRPAQAEDALQQALALRTHLYGIFAAVAAERTPEARDMRALNEALQMAFPHLEMVSDETGFHWQWSADQHDLKQVLWPVVWDAADLLKSDQLEDVRECASNACNWLFMDTSKNHSRRWCDMRSCGNREKARSHYHRTRSTVE